jgi:hypothetical protein
MGQHFIPQYYLKGFGNDLNFDNIWVYEKGSSRVFNTTIGSVANENQRWPDKTEKYLANQIEAPANSVIEKIVARQTVTPQDKDIFSAYMVVMWKRVPEGLKRANALAPKAIDEAFDRLHNEILRLMEEHPSKASALESKLQELPNLRAKYENEFPKELWYFNITPDTPLRLRVWFSTMTWVFLTSDKGQQPFLTSDNPVFFFPDIGIGKPESEITFPVSSTTTLWVTWRADLQDGYLSASENAVKEINRRTVGNATRYVYYSQNAGWVASLVNKKGSNIRVHRLV